MTRRFSEVSTTLLRAGYSIRFRAAGQSMHPTIRHGDMITVEPVPPAAVTRGDIIVYRIGRGIIAHRVVAIRGGRGHPVVYITRGDACNICDAPAPGWQLVGKVVAVERRGWARATRLTRRWRSWLARLGIMLIVLGHVIL